METNMYCSCGGPLVSVWVDIVPRIVTDKNGSKCYESLRISREFFSQAAAEAFMDNVERFGIRCRDGEIFYPYDILGVWVSDVEATEEPKVEA